MAHRDEFLFLIYSVYMDTTEIMLSTDSFSKTVFFMG